MRFNDKELILISKKEADLTGRLQYTQYKGPPGAYKASGFRDRFFKLIGNLLFYFRFHDLRAAVDFSEPVGVIVLENYSVQPEYDVDLSFAFGIIFLDEPDRRHIFTARTDNDVQLWINTLQTASYQHWSHLLARKRTRLNALLESRKEAASAPKELFLPQESVDSSSKGSEKKDVPLISFDEDSNSNLVPSSEFHFKPLPPPPIPPRPVSKKKDNNDLIQF